ncbi:MAG TPA: peptide chain release factor N(5)-glutamine methyltransferase [Gemmatimonadales bacterium]|nr:peptide chain release factor N(5)-glutamine methyltransferase [Gemmatimonadales bacterium]
MRERGGPTIADALDDAAQRLAGVGVAEAGREARALWATVAGATLGDVWLGRHRAPAPDVARHFGEAVERRANGAPFAYATGKTHFRTLELAIDRRALIPRPETEGLVDLVLRMLGATGNGQRATAGTVADIGAGCGCIALSLAVEGAFDRVIAVERAPAAATLARENLARVQPPVPVEIREGDLLAPLAGERVRAIVSNPPYLTDAEYLDLDPAVRLWEPREALASGPDGLDATRALLAGARGAGLLEPGGFLALEIDERRADAVRTLACAYHWPRVAVYDDLFGRPRYLLAGLEEDA